MRAKRDTIRLGGPPDNPDENELVKLQKKIYNLVEATNQPSRSAIINKTRQRVERWELGLPIGYVSRRIDNRIQHLKGRAAPKMIIAYIKLLLNAWNTGRRFRHMAGRGHVRRCLFCGVGPDAIEHFYKCTIVKDLFRSYNCSCTTLLQFFALDQASFPSHFLVKVNLLACLYTVHNSINSTCTPLHVKQLIRAATSMALQPPR